MKDKKYNPFSRILKNQKGVSAILVAILLPVLIGFAALAIDVGYMYTTKNELQNIADGAALAGASELGRIYLGMDPTLHSTYELSSDDEELIREAAIDVAALNDAAGLSITINDNDIHIGVWNFIQAEFEESEPTIGPDAVRVTARRDSTLTSIEGPVGTFFARIFSIFGGSHDTFDSSALATAALTGIGDIDKGVLKAPFAISEHHNCMDPILKFSPTADSCAGWHNFFDKISANALDNKMIGLVKGYGEIDVISNKTEGETWLETWYDIKSNQMPDSQTTPETIAGESKFYLQGGEVSSVFIGGEHPFWIDKNSTEVDIGNLEQPAPFLTIFDFFRFRDNDGSGEDTIDFCGQPVKADNIWTTTVPIYNDPTGSPDGGCTNPNKQPLIVGFANVMIRMPNRENYDEDNFPPDDYTKVEVCYDCNFIVEHGRGSGNNLGNIKGSIPNLVE